ncbi:MAG TPA: sugar ABC transporter ATP-binding protein [Syntrophorhabdales bacterium]|nr:sugar ABC transporter ATP-binding protein [Syntrophorhabdales bacterium]
MPDSTGSRGVAPLLSLTGLHKWFGGVHALCDARMVLQKTGVVHALMGQNGSGKSTMLNILSGQIRPDEGVIAIGGSRATFRSPLDALAHGISMVSQETALAEDLSIAENILLGHRLIRGRMGINWSATHDRAREVLQQVGADYDPAWIVRSLRPDQKQMVEIARAMSTDVRILVLDEPTSSLTDEETKGLFAAIRRLKKQGVCIIYVSHRLPEVFEISDEMTVLRDGVTVAEGQKSDFTPRSLVAAMVGTEKPVKAGPTRESGVQAKAVLQIRGLTLEGSVSNVDLDVHEGEIVGLGGLIGSGRREVLEAIYGLRRATSGTILLSGKTLKNENPLVAIKHGVGFVPPDRKTQGVILPMTVQDNLAMAATSERQRLSSPCNGKIEEECRATSRLLSIKADLDADVSTLSGGNQQKVALGKWLLRPPKVLLLDEPTRGVDVSAKGEIHRHLREAASRGIAMLVSSSEYDELCDLCDRIVVFFRGCVVATIPREEASETRLAALGGGSKEG